MAAHNATSPRPDCMVTLGLLPPYVADDIRRAYLRKVRDVHPDHGGDPAAFDRLESAYQQALQYISFRSDRRQWIAAHMDEYVAQQAAINRLRNLGASVEVQSIDWVQRSFGDFAQLTERVETVAAPGMSNANDIVAAMVELSTALTGLKRLDLSESSLDDDHIYELRVLRTLTELDVRRTPLTNRAAGIVHWLPRLQWMHVEGTKIGWWTRFKTARLLARRRSARGAVPAHLHPENIG